MDYGYKQPYMLHRSLMGADMKGEPMDDLISRQAVKELAHNQVREKYCGAALKEDRDFYIKLADSIIDLLPSAQPETAKRIVGKSRDGMTLWYQCDMCNEPVDAQDNFCRGCGRRLTDE